MWHDGLGGGRAVRVPSRVVVEWWTDILGPTPNALLADGPPRPQRRLVSDLLRGRADRPHPSRHAFGLRDLEPATASWAFALFGTPGVPPNQYVRDREPKLLGSELHVWNDDPGETEDQIAAGIFPRLRVLAQKTWGTRRAHAVL